MIPQPAIRKCLVETTINLDRIRDIGVKSPDCFVGARSVVWKVLLDYLPTEQAKWENVLTDYRENYYDFVNVFVTGQSVSEANDDPLSANPTGHWASYFEDNATLTQINKDCRRICPEMDFVYQTTDYPLSRSALGSVNCAALRNRLKRSRLETRDIGSNITGSRTQVNSSLGADSRRKLLGAGMMLSSESRFVELKEKQASNGPDLVRDEFALAEGEELHWEVVQRILYIYCKVTKMPYIQGMNELIVPIYYVFLTSEKESDRVNCEAHTFFCFHNMMTELQANFIKTEDDAHGIKHQMRTFEDILHHVDSELAAYLVQIDLKPEYYAFRWISLLLAREFALPDVIKLWDCLLSDEHRFDLLLFVCVAMLLLVKKELMNSSFPNAVKMVLDYPIQDVGVVMHKAHALYALRDTILVPDRTVSQRCLTAMKGRLA